MPVLRSDPSVARAPTHSVGRRRFRSTDPLSLGSEVTPGFSFARPGPMDGVGSLASRIDSYRHGGTLERAGLDCLCVRVWSESLSIHRYYDQLRLPNARPRFLRRTGSSPRTCRLRVCCPMDRPGGAAGLSGGGALISRWTPAKCHLRIDPRLS